MNILLVAVTSNYIPSRCSSLSCFAVALRSTGRRSRVARIRAGVGGQERRSMTRRGCSLVYPAVATSNAGNDMALEGEEEHYYRSKRKHDG